MYQLVWKVDMFLSMEKADELNIEELFQVKIKKHIFEVFLILVNIGAVTREGSRAYNMFASHSSPEWEETFRSSNTSMKK